MRNEIIDYWVSEARKEFEFNEFESSRIYNQLHELGLLHIHELENRSGVVCYTIAPDLKGGNTVLELFMYIKPEKRRISNFFKLLGVLEEAGKKWGSVRISSGFAFKGDKLLLLLMKRGYKLDTVRKEF